MKENAIGVDEWWTEFFSGQWLEVQQAAKPREATHREATAVEALLTLRPPARVLDVPAGTGRLAIELASRGYRMCALELSALLIAEGKKNARQQDVTVEWHCGDMRDLSWKETFDAVVCLWNSFGYFSDEDNERFIRRVADSLRPGGRVLVDTHTLETILPRFQARHWRKVENILALEEARYDPYNSRINSAWTYVANGRPYTRSMSIRIYTQRELRELFGRAGLADICVYGSMEGQPFVLGAERSIIIAKKSGTVSSDL